MISGSTFLSAEPRRAQVCSTRVATAQELAASAAGSLVLELETWPKPGLVSHVDTGSHDDMDAESFRRSAAAIEPFFTAMADNGARGCGMGRLRSIGLDAEAAMLRATSGVNTHRGAIFGLGLLCAAAGARASGRVDREMQLGAAVSRLWGEEIAMGPILLNSHGSWACRSYGVGGARMEAATGFPSVYEVGLPALRRSILASPGDPEAARVETCFSLIAAVEDTNLLHRGGTAGLQFARRASQRFLDEGGISRAGWRACAALIHDRFVARRLSPGGSADLLAMSLFVEANEVR